MAAWRSNQLSIIQQLDPPRNPTRPGAFQNAPEILSSSTALPEVRVRPCIPDDHPCYEPDYRYPDEDDPPLPAALIAPDFRHLPEEMALADEPPPRRSRQGGTRRKRGFLPQGRGGFELRGRMFQTNRCYVIKLRDVRSELNGRRTMGGPRSGASFCDSDGDGGPSCRGLHEVGRGGGGDESRRGGREHRLRHSREGCWWEGANLRHFGIPQR